MNHLDERLQEDLERWITLIGEDVFSGPSTLGAVDVLRAHYLIVDHFYREGEGVGGVGPRDANLLLSTLGRQKSSFGGYTKWTEDLDICATLFFGLIKNHVFHDANKRTAFLSLLYHLWKIGRTPAASQRDFEILAIRIASNELAEYKEYRKYADKLDPEVRFLASVLRSMSRPIVRRNYPMITYHDLDTILHRFHYRLAYPNGNRINVIKVEEENYWPLFIRRKKTVETYVTTIPFPNWKKEVSRSELSRLRKLLDLTPERGVDSEVFFKDATPLIALIDRYEPLFQRLADR